MNDPCGLIHWNREYHLHYQYHPYSSNWGTMHWGHAVSSDLYHWEEQEIAIAPDPVNGNAYSGSAVLDTANSSGYFEGEGIVAIYTGALPTDDPDFPIQQQCLAYSPDGYRWTKHPGGPVIANDGSRDFRDPRVLFHQESGYWVMVLAAGTEVRFYRSLDLLQWEYQSSFSLGYGPLECPELLEFADGEMHVWVLVVHCDSGRAGELSGSRYLTGSFDGRQFYPDHGTSRAVDHGFEFYAAQRWSNSGDRVVWVGWAGRPYYSHDIPTESWRNLLSLPRELGLVRAGETWCLTQQPAAETLSLREREIAAQTADGSGDRTYRITGREPVELLASVGRGRTLTITLAYGEAYSTTVTIDNRERMITIDRSASGMDTYGDRWRYRRNSKIPGDATGNPLPVRLFWDSCILEFFAADGLYTATALVFSPCRLGSIEVFADSVTRETVRVYALKGTMTFECGGTVPDTGSGVLPDE